MKTQQKNTEKFSIRRSRAGLGLFANSLIKKGTRVIEYTGELISEEEANKRGGKYLFALNGKRTVDGRARENIARYINHSCKPNCYAEINNAETRIFIFAKRSIEPGEELTYNYGKDHFDAYIRPHGCKCDACTKKAP